MNRISNSIIMRAVFAALFLVTVASASVMGNLDIGSGGMITVTITSATFSPDPSSTPAGPPWDAEVAVGTSLTFTGSPLLTTEGVDISSPLTAASVGENNFLTFAAHPLLVYSLLGIGPGSSNTNCAAAVNVGDSCSVFAGSPIILTRTSNGTSASFSVNGKASDTGAAGLATASTYNGTLSEPLVQPLPNGLAPTPANIQAYFCPGGVCDQTKSISTPFSGNFFATTVPEPQTTALVLGGLLVLLGKVGMRRLNRSR
jgi:hypothetical protein